jgi:hypothetical protein
VAIVTRLLADRSGSKSWHVQVIFSAQKLAEPVWDQPILLFNCYRRFFLEVKRQGREFNCLSPSNTEVNKE